MRGRAIAAAAVPAVLALATYQVDRHLRNRLAPAPREMPHTAESFGLPADDVWLTSTVGSVLHGWFVPPVSAPAPAVVVMHGWGANGSLMLPIAAHLWAAGWAVVVADARGHGHSELVDHVSMPRFADDLDTFVDWAVRQPEVDGAMVVGHSVGAGAALLCASRRDDLAGVVAVGTFADPRELMGQAGAMQRLPPTLRRGVFRRMELAMDVRFDDIVPLRTIADARCPVMLVHGDADQVIPMHDFERLAAAARPGTATLVVPGGAHDRFDEYLPFLGEVVGFLRSVPMGHDAPAAQPGA